MKFLATSLVFAAAVIAVPAPANQGNALVQRSPIAAAFAEAFPGRFTGLSEDDTNIFCSKENDAADDAKAKAAKLKREAEAAIDDAAMATSKARRSEYIRRNSEEDVNVFCSSEKKRSGEAARKAIRSKREADAAAELAVEANSIYTEALKQVVKRTPAEDDTNVFCSKENEATEIASTKARMLRREADAAAEAALDSAATVAYALEMRSDESDVNVFCSSDAAAAEKASAKAKKLKREAAAAVDAAASSEASLIKALKLRATF